MLIIYDERLCKSHMMIIYGDHQGLMIEDKQLCEPYGGSLQSAYTHIYPPAPGGRQAARNFLPICCFPNPLPCSLEFMVFLAPCLTAWRLTCYWFARNWLPASWPRGQMFNHHLTVLPQLGVPQGGTQNTSEFQHVSGTPPYH